jgi:cytoskeletal protein RodZ
MKNKSKNKIEIQLPMKFNPGLSKFEPELPLRKSRKKFKLKINWVLWLILLIGIFSIGYTIIILMINYK